MKSTDHINLVIMPIPADKGMAGTTRVRNFIKFLPKDNMTITNLVMDTGEESYEYLGVQIKRVPTAHLSMRAKFKRLKAELEELYDPHARNVLFYYDIPHTPVLAYLLYSARKKWGYSTIVDVVEDYNTQKLNLGIKGNIRLLFSGYMQKHLHWIADGAIGISAYLMDFLRRHYSNQNTVHLPVAFDPTTIIDKPATDKETVAVFYGGTYGEKDGMEFLLNGFEKAAQEAGQLELHLTGKGSPIDMKKFQALLSQSGVSTRIMNHGFVSYEEYCHILGAADILCMTRRNSKFANAGFPYKLGEFLATGKPVIVSRLSEIEKYLDDDDCCFVQPESSSDIGKAIITLLDPNKRREFGKKGKEKAFRYFNAEKVADNLYVFIQKIAGQS